MIYVTWALFLGPTFFMAILGRLLAPILPLFADKYGWLPRWLIWFQTLDNSLDGDEGHLKRWPRNSLFWTYCRRVAWLLRNVAYGFDDLVIGVKTLPTDILKKEGNSSASDTNGISGTCWRTLYRDGKLIAWHLYYVKHYQIWRIKACIRVSLGWKLWNPSAIHKQYTCYLHPFKKFEWR